MYYGKHEFYVAYSRLWWACNLYIAVKKLSLLSVLEMKLYLYETFNIITSLYLYRLRVC